MSETQEFFSFEEALDRLRLKEEELKRLVSEGEIRAFRDGETMRLRRRDVDELRTELMGGDVVDLGGLEDMAFEDEGDFDQPGMATEELSAADTLLDEELEVLELEPDPIEGVGELEELEEEEVEDELVAAGAADEDDFSPLALALVFGTTMVLLLTMPILISLGSGSASDVAKSIGGIFVPFDEESDTVASGEGSDAETSETESSESAPTDSETVPDDAE